MKKILYILVLALFILVPLQGCSSIKDENELMNDLLSNSSFSLPAEAEAKNLSVVKRLTDEKSKTDTVYIQIDVENTEFFQTRSYIMNYTHYNEGWLLDNIEEYWENDYWIVHPKVEPNDQIVLDTLILWSNAQIKSHYDNEALAYPVQGPMYFEEGKYEVDFVDRKLNESSYTCLLYVDRPFEYITSLEEIQVTMAADPYTFTWELTSAESMSLSAEWFYAHSWSNEDCGIRFSNINIKENKMALTDLSVYVFPESYDIPDIELNLAIPSFTQIEPASATIAHEVINGSLYADVIFWPDGMWLCDRDGEIAKLDGYIEFFYTLVEEPENYTETAKNAIEALWKNHNIDDFINALHPSIRDQFRNYMGDSTDLNNIPPLESYSIGEVEIFSDYSENMLNDWDKWQRAQTIMDAVREENYRVDALGLVEFELVYNGMTSSALMILAEDDETIYILGFD